LHKQNAYAGQRTGYVKKSTWQTGQKADTLSKQNQDLDAKVKVAQALKLATSNMVAYKIKGSGKEVDVTRAGPC
jgi:hypothetical protein